MNAQQPNRPGISTFISSHPFPNRSFNDQKLPDEVLFYLTGLDHEFEEKIRLYAGARAMAMNPQNTEQNTPTKLKPIFAA